ncbi:MAG: hypothetical protein D8H94_12525 [Cardiobacterium sp.]|nr:MAG: hypothetical protein D8H94_12525 [Cardiobacterium sp.]
MDKAHPSPSAKRAVVIKRDRHASCGEGNFSAATLRARQNSITSPLDGLSVYAAWRIQCLSRLTGPVFTPLGETSVHASLASDDFLPRTKG